MTSYDPDRHGPVRLVGPGFHARVHALLRLVPAGSVTTYGDLAGALGSRTIARQVGFALAALPPDSRVPWHRVVDGSGRLTGAGSARAREQAARLRAEGIGVAGGRVVGFAARRHVFPAADPRPRGAGR
ncbi:MAG: MGMT family protein [Planctomycetes bacterium]|nr:MGMT family protein [Planctomycetota bacterium]